MADVVPGAELAFIAAGGGIVGAVIATTLRGALDWFLAAGKVRTDRVARDEARKDRRDERRDDLQRQTLIELQTAVLDLSRITLRAHVYNLDAIHRGERWGRATWPEDIHREFNQAIGMVDLLRSRVRETELRDAAAQVSSNYFKITQGQDLGGTMNAVLFGDAAVAHVQHRAGQLIREMDDVP